MVECNKKSKVVKKVIMCSRCELHKHIPDGRFSQSERKPFTVFLNIWLRCQPASLRGSTPSLFAEFLDWRSLQPYSWLVRFMHVQLTQWNLYYRKIEGKTCFQPPQHPFSKHGWLLTCCTFFLHFFHWANVCTPVLTSCFEQKGCVGTSKPFRWSKIYNSQQPMRERICCVCLSVFEPTAVQTKCQP